MDGAPLFCAIPKELFTPPAPFPTISFFSGSELFFVLANNAHRFLSLCYNPKSQTGETYSPASFFFFFFMSASFARFRAMALVETIAGLL